MNNIGRKQSEAAKKAAKTRAAMKHGRAQYDAYVVRSIDGQQSVPLGVYEDLERCHRGLIRDLTSVLRDADISDVEALQQIHALLNEAVSTATGGQSRVTNAPKET
jgi:hypothetical protein